MDPTMPLLSLLAVDNKTDSELAGWSRLLSTLVFIHDDYARFSNAMSSPGMQ